MAHAGSSGVPSVSGPRSVHFDVVSARQPAGRIPGAAVGVAVILTVLSGCGGDSSSSSLSTTDTNFVAAVTSAAPDINTYRSDSQLILLGQAACDDFAAGASYQELADRLSVLQGSHPMPSADLGAVITSAVATMCPKYRSQIS